MNYRDKSEGASPGKDSYWYERDHGKIDLYVEGKLRACVDYSTGAAIVLPNGRKAGIRIVAAWSKDIFSLVEKHIGVLRVNEIRYPPVERIDWRSLASKRTKNLVALYGLSPEFDYFVNCASISLFFRRDPAGRDSVRKPRLRAGSAKALDTLMEAKRVLKQAGGKQRALRLVLKAKGFLEGIPATKTMAYDRLALAEIKMALASLRPGKYLREPLPANEAEAISDEVARFAIPF